MSGRPDILTERVELPASNGAPMGAFVARPAGAGPRPGVVVAHELFGVTMHVREVCERLAAMGTTALAPDLYHRTAPATELAHDAAGREHGFTLLHQLTRDEVLADMGAAVEHLRGGGSRRVAALGLSLGGHVAYLAATSLDLDAVVALYPGWLTGTEIAISRPEPTLARTPGIRGRVLVLCGAQDHAVPEADLEAINAALAAAGVRHELVAYPDTPHGFLCDRRDTFAPTAAEDAWRRISALLSEELGAGA
jgi:carboxymethylenebutenolidase